MLSSQKFGKSKMTGIDSGMLGRILILQILILRVWMMQLLISKTSVELLIVMSGNGVFMLLLEAVLTRSELLCLLF